MPVMQFAINELNRRFHPETITEQGVESFADERSFRQVLCDDLEIPQGIDDLDPDAFGDYLDTAPDALVKAFHATVRSAISRGQPITMAWQPGYDWELTISDVSDMPRGTPGGITMLIKSRYPGDPSPVDSSQGKK